MDLSRLFMRMAMIVRRPPSRPQLIAIAVVAAVVAVCVAVEWAGLWPEALTADRVRTPRL
ncbi:hypothetical protein [Methylopila turkensis]|uniref:Uncharacterized protein n=1 Tax=Methylopila turkensis TaxID=1437816 RepID=A0A9W6JL02_9HYPH|nr:hypothetical protein [Methylopila turkensis]GLK78321.1 hypothetical protein GCM10008174_00620 [Methylopila turkensis]